MARPSSTSRRTSATCSARRSSTSEPSTTGHAARWTESGVVRRRGEQVLPDPFGDERDERRHQQRHDVQALVQRGERGGVAGPEPAARAAHVPVGQVVDEAGEQTAGALGVERLQRRVHLADEPVRLGQRPPVQRRALGRPRGRRRARVPSRRPVPYSDWNDDGVPVREQRLADDLLDRAVPDPAGRQGEPPAAMNQRTASAPWCVHQRDRLQDVAEVLGHLAAVLVEDVAEADHVLVRRTGRRRACRSPSACRTSRGSGRSPRR